MIVKFGETFFWQVAVNAFSVWVGLGATVGLWRIVRSAPQRQAETWLNAGLFVLFFTLAGARLSYIWLNWSYFASHLVESAMIWLGGLTWPGAFAGAGLALIMLSLLYRNSPDRLPPHTPYLPLGWVGDRLYPLLPPLAIAVWIGCWQSGIAYGVALPAGTWWGMPALDASGASSLRFPLQPLAALTLLEFFWLLETRIRPLRPPGLLFGLAVAGLLLHLAAFSLLRDDPAPYWNGLRLDTWFAVFSLALLLILAIINNLVLRSGRKSAPSYPERFIP
jgi:prolipoprotein diacylglyceryltransferase